MNGLNGFFADKKIFFLNKILSIFIVISIFFTFYLLLSSVSKGFDITDNAFYQLVIQNPYEVKNAISQFGFLFNPIYILLNQNFNLLTLAGILILFLLACLFVFVSREYLNLQKFTLENSVIFLTLSSSILIYYGIWWLITPSYNWLALVACLLVGSGILLLDSNRKYSKKYSLFYSLITSIGIVIGLLTKPTTGAMLIFGCVIWVTINNKSKVRWFNLVYISVFSLVLFYIYTVLVYKGVVEFYHNVSLSYKYVQVAGFGHSISNTFLKAVTAISDLFKWLIHSLYIKTLIILNIFLWICSISKKNIFLNSLSILKIYNKKIIVTLLRFNILIWFLQLIYLYQYKFISWIKIQNTSDLSYLLYKVFFIFFLIFLISCQLSPKKHFQSSKVYIYKMSWYTGLLLFIPFAFSLGTNSNIISHSSNAGFFIVISIWITFNQILHIIRINYFKIIINSIIVLQLFLCILNGYNHPYRLNSSIKNQNLPITLLSSSNPIRVDLKTYQYINKLKNIAKKNNWKINTPLLDMTGASPGVLLILHGKFLGSPWFCGGYPGSSNYMEAILKSYSKNILLKSWILTAPNGERVIDIKILKQLGLNFPDDYIPVGKLEEVFREEKQILWKPKMLIK